MSRRCLDVLERFGESFSSSDYNARDCWRHGALLPVEEEPADTLADFENVPEAERLTVRAQIDLDLATKLNAFATRMAAAAVNTRRVTFLIAAIRALALDDNVREDRDVAYTLAVMFDAGTRIHEPVADMIQASCKFATPRRARLFQAFLDAPSEVRLLKSMGYEFREGPEGGEYVFRGIM